MPDEAAARPNLIRALRETAVTALLAFGLFLPLIGFNTVQNIRNELVLETRWPLLLTLVALIAAGRFVHVLIIVPALARRVRHAPSERISRLQAWLARFATPAAI